MDSSKEDLVVLDRLDDNSNNKNNKNMTDSFFTSKNSEENEKFKIEPLTDLPVIKKLHHKTGKKSFKKGRKQHKLVELNQQTNILVLDDEQLESNTI